MTSMFPDILLAGISSSGQHYIDFPYTILLFFLQSKELLSNLSP